MKEIGIANLPNLKHKIHTEKGIRFNMAVAGSHGLGKTTFINNFLGQIVFKEHFNTKIIQESCRIETTNLDLEEENLKIRMDLIKINGIGDCVNNSNVTQPIREFLLQKYDEYSAQFDNKVKSEIEDPRIHLCIYFLEPVNYLKQSDVDAMTAISEYCTIIPVVAKSDLLVPEEINEIRRLISTTFSNHESYFISCTTDCSEIKEYNWGVVKRDNFDFHKLRQDVLEKETLGYYEETEFLYDTYRINILAGKVVNGQSLLTKLNGKQHELDEIKERIRHKKKILGE
ncbi:SPN4 [Enterospora canceri]|uniref:SPN4 n=1 Tax=Enterospora canceri TaxID=1081671 RepID=A0A1Y1S661_9MICR|nr:SPN4 [Enterospora canceri]